MTNIKSNKDKFLAVIIFIINLIPYFILSEGFISSTILLIGVIYIFKRKFKIFIDGYILICLLTSIMGIISLKQSMNIISSIEGIAIYLCGIIFYYIFYNLKDKKEYVYDLFVYSFTIGVLVFTGIQGIVMNKRVDGNIGYANTYAILIIVSLYINRIRQNDKFKVLIEYILITGVLYTGSRYSLLFLGIFIVAEIILVRKYKSNSKVMINLILAIVTYTICSKLGPMAVILMPPIIYGIYYINSNSNLKLKKVLNLTLMISSLGFICMGNTQLFLRVKNISIHNPVLQERFIYYEDSIKAILSNIVGFGLNSFQYRQYGIQSAFYDVKYIHNSLIQDMFDLGILGGILFISLFIYGLIYINKNINNKKIYYLMMYVSIYAHSMLDFDFSFATLIIIISMILALNKKDSVYIYKEMKDKHLSNIIKLIITVLSVYLICCNLFIFIGGVYEDNREFYVAKMFYKINERLTFGKNAETYGLLAEVSNGEERINMLYKAEKLNPYDPRIKLNIAFSNENNNAFYDADKYYEKVLKIERFNKEVYSKYYLFLKKAYNTTKDKTFLHKQYKLKELYNENLKRLNNRAKYIKNQMPQNFNEVVRS